MREGGSARACFSHDNAPETLLPFLPIRLPVSSSSGCSSLRSPLQSESQTPQHCRHGLVRKVLFRQPCPGKL